jgi:hypothetical protein
LSAAVQLYSFHEAAAIIGVELQVEWEEAFVIDIADKGVEKVASKGSSRLGRMPFSK